MSDLAKRRRAALARRLVRVDVACNNPNNGCFAHEAAGIHFPACCLQLEGWWRPRRFVELDGAVRLSGKRWPVVDSKDWVGNWCWNGYWMRADAAAALALLRPPDGTYPTPAHGWTCFHCGETFHLDVQARMHFGATPGATPACRLQRKDWPLMYAFRALEAERDELLVRLRSLRCGADENEAAERFRALRGGR